MQQRFEAVPCRFLAFGLVVLFAAFGPTGVLAQDGVGGRAASGENQVREIEPDQLRIGNRTRIVLKNGSEFEGQVMGLRKEQVRLNLSYENLSLSGNVTLQKEDIDSVFVLPSLSMKTRKEILKAKERFMKSRSASNGTVEKKADRAEQKNGASSEDGEKSVSEMKLTAEHRRLLKKFPEDTWDQERYRSVESKYAYQRTTREREFLKNWDRLQEAREIQTYNRYRELLDKFPPDEGWGKERYEKLSTEKGLLPGRGREVRTPTERQFIEEFDTWKAALKWKKKQEQKKKEKEEKQTKEAEQADREESETTAGQGDDASPDTSDTASNETGEDGQTTPEQ